MFIVSIPNNDKQSFQNPLLFENMGELISNFFDIFI